LDSPTCGHQGARSPVYGQSTANEEQVMNQSNEFSTVELVDLLLDKLNRGDGINFVKLEKIQTLLDCLEQVEINRMGEEFYPPWIDPNEDYSDPDFSPSYGGTD
jgi:hypothetical protein